MDGCFVLHFFFSSLFYVKLPFSTFGLRYAPFNSDSRLFEVRWVSLVPSPTVAAQPLYMLGEYFPKTSYQYSSRFAFSKIPSPPLLVVLDSRHPTIHTYIYIYINLRPSFSTCIILHLATWLLGYYYYHHHHHHFDKRFLGFTCCLN